MIDALMNLPAQRASSCVSIFSRFTPYYDGKSCELPIICAILRSIHRCQSKVFRYLVIFTNSHRLGDIMKNGNLKAL